MAFLLDELNRVVQELEADGVEYAVCGGLAMAIQGFPRATMDIDILIQEESLDKTLQIAAGHGFDIRGPDISFVDPRLEIRRVSKIIDGVLLSLDLLLAFDEIENVWTSRERLPYMGRQISVISRDGLIFLKTRAGRLKTLPIFTGSRMKKIDMSERAIERRLRQVDQLNAVCIELMRGGMKHYEKLVAEGKASEKELRRFKKYLV